MEYQNIPTPQADLAPQTTIQLSEAQQKVMGCIACITDLGSMYATEVVRKAEACTGFSKSKTFHALYGLDEKGLVTRRARTTSPEPDVINPSANEHTISAEGLALLPEGWQPCDPKDREAQDIFAALPARQQRMLGCIACLSGKAKRGEIAAVRRSFLATCQGIPTEQAKYYTKKFRKQGIFYEYNGPDSEPNRASYTPTPLGEKVISLATFAENCSTDSTDKAPEKTRKVDIISKCLGCIWTKQIASGEDPAATKAMIAHCSGRSAPSVLESLRQLVEEGAAARTRAPHNVMLNDSRPVAAYGPPGQLRKLPETGGDQCKLPLYTDIDASYLQPLSSGAFTNPPRHKSQSFYNDQWFLEAKRHQLLTPEEEAVLAHTIQHSPDNNAKEVALQSLIRHNFKLAVWGVKQNAQHLIFLPYQDALDAAIRGVGEAAQRFKPDTGTRFIAYAVHWIRQSIQREAGKYIGVPAHDYVHFGKTAVIAKDFQQEFGRMPSILELARITKLRPEHVERIIARRQHAVAMLRDRLDSHVNLESNKTRHEVIGRNDQALDMVTLQESLRTLRGYLSPFEDALLLNTLHDMGHSADTTADSHNIESQATQNARQRVASLLRHPFFGIFADVHEWQDDALCNTKNDDSVITSATGIVKNATRELCGSCPVDRQCGSYAKNAQPSITAGIWNGRPALEYNSPAN